MILTFSIGQAGNIKMPTRYPAFHQSQVQNTKLTRERLCEMQRKDPNLERIISYLENGKLPEQSSKARETVALSNDFEISMDGILYHLWSTNSKKRRQEVKRQIVVPRCLIDEILFACLDDAMAGHLSFHKTYTKIQDRFYWKGMYSDVEFAFELCQNYIMFLLVL